MSIATRLEAIEEHLTDDYSVLELAGADLTNVDKNIVNLKPTWKERLLYFINNGTDIVWENWEKVGGEGTELTLSNTEQAPMKVLLKGNTYQDSTTQSANLFDANYYNNDSIYFTDTYKYTLARFKGDRTLYAKSTLKEGKKKQTGYYLALSNSPGKPYQQDTVTAYAISNGNTAEQGKSFEGEETLYINVYPNNADLSVIFDNYNILVSTDNISYVPFVPDSPTPDYPQEVHVVSGDNEVEVLGKNLFNINGDVNTRYDGSTPSNPQNTVLNGDLTTITNTNNFHPFGQKIYVGAGNTIYFSAKLKSVSYSTTPSGSASVGGISIYNDSTQTGRKTLSYTYSELNTYKSDSITATTDYIYLCFGRSGNVNSTTFTDIMLSSSNDTTYKPYQSTTYPINLPEGMFLGSIGDYKDTFFKAEEGNPIYDSLDSATKQTLDSNEWYLEKKIGKVVLNGTEDWTQATASGQTYWYTNLPNSRNITVAIERTLLFCDYFKPKNANTEDGFYQYGNNVIIFNHGIANTLVDFQTWLSTHNTEVYYILATPTYTKIEGTLASQLEAVYRAKSKEGQTNISQTNNDLPFELSVSALSKE